MPPTLLSLPDELLDLVVDQALGEFAPRLYKARQDTCRTLSLVNKRVGAIAQPKLVEVVHAFMFSQPGFRARLKLEQVPRRNRVRVLCLEGVGLNGSVDGFLSFAAVRDLRLTVFREVRLEDLGQLPELRALVLSNGSFSINKPLVAPKLERLAISSCAFNRLVDMQALTAKGCPSLRHLYADMLPKPRPLWTRDLVAQVETLGVELYYDYSQRPSWTSIVGPGNGPEDEAFFDKALFDLYSSEVDNLPDSKRDVKHLRLHVSGTLIRVDSTPIAAQLAVLAGHLSTAYPALETLYLPLVLDTSRVMHQRKLVDAVEKLVAACARQHVEVVHEHGLDADVFGEDRAAPHFEARCRRIKAERAAAATTTSARLSGARAVH
ncbi:hypothetical protein JCM3775_005384 [Rhodotorula graminis]